ncbi:MAG: hypothetical protein ACE364_08030 [Chlorobiota bacterium]
MIKKYYHIILSILLFVLLLSCEDSLGTDPDYKKTILKIDTIIKLDTIVTIDTVKSPDSTKYIFTIDSLIIVKDSLGNIIDSLNKVIIKNREIAPRFNPILKETKTLVTYNVFDTLFNSQNNEEVITKKLIALHQPEQFDFNNFKLELDTNLNRNWAWINFTFDGQFNARDTTASQKVYLSSSNLKMDSVLTFNSYILKPRQNNESLSFLNSILDIKGVNINSKTLQDVEIRFNNFSFDITGKINGFDVLIDFNLQAGSIPYVNKHAHYSFILVYDY